MAIKNENPIPTPVLDAKEPGEAYLLIAAALPPTPNPDDLVSVQDAVLPYNELASVLENAFFSYLKEEQHRLDTLDPYQSILPALESDPYFLDILFKGFHDYIQQFFEHDQKVDVGSESSNEGDFNSDNFVKEVLKYFDTVNSVPRTLVDSGTRSDYFQTPLLVNTDLNQGAQFVNHAPFAQNDFVSLSEGNKLVIAAPGIIANDIDPDGGVLVVYAVNSAASNVGSPLVIGAGGILNVAATGEFLFDTNGKYEALAQGQTATESFTYQVRDAYGALSNISTVTITIVGENDAPIAATESIQADEDTTYILTKDGLLLNDIDIDNGAKLTVAAVNGSAANVGIPISIGLGGLLTVNADGSVSFNPNGKYDNLAQGQTLSESFTYQAMDEFGALSNVVTVPITITGVNDAPVAVADFAVTNEDSILNASAGDLLLNDSDIDNGAVLAVAKVNGSSANIGVPVSIGLGALVTVNADGGYSVDPNGKYESLAQGQSTTVSFTYQIIDEFGALSAAAPTVTITITGVNDAPIASNDTATIGENGILTVVAAGVLLNDTDVDAGASRTVGTVNGLAANVGVPIAIGLGGILTVNTNGSFSFNTNNAYDYLGVGQTGTETFTYQAIDEFGALSNPATVTISITGTNDIPVAVADFIVTDEHTVLNVGKSGLLLNDTDADSNAVLSIAKVNGSAANVGKAFSIGAGILVTVNADGSYIVDPNGKYESLAQGKSATATFTYQTVDDQGALSVASPTVTITINGVNDAPIANNDSATTGENTTLSVVVGSGLLVNDTDVDTGATRTVGTVNGLAANVGVATAIGLGGLLTVNANGSYSFNPNGKYDFLAVGQTATETFIYQAKDEFGALSNPATVTITITGANDLPVTVADAASTDEHTILTVAKAGLLLNDTDPDNGAILSVAKVNTLAANVGKTITLASGALLTVNADGSYIFDPNGKYESLAQGKTATATFTYQTIDEKGALSAAAATVTITINGVNDAPIAVNDARTTGENTTLNVTGTGILANDTDIDTGAIKSVATVNGSAANIGVPIAIGLGGLLTVNATGAYTFNPNGKYDYLAVGQSTTESFTYQTKDEFGALSNVATVTITITGANDLPISVADSASTDEHTVLTVAKAGVLLNDTDLDNNAVLSVGRVNSLAANVGKTITLASGALLTVNADGSYIFDPNGKYESLAQGKTATATFTYQAIDDQGGLSAAAATVTITINGVNDAPIAVDNTGTTGENTTLNVTGTGILANDTDIDTGAIKSVATVNGSAANIGVPIAIGLGGLLTVNATGSYSFNPNGKYDFLAVGQTATETFTYQAKDEFGALSNVATVTITITGANDLPIAVADSASTDEHTVLTVAKAGLLLNDTDLDNGAILSVARVNTLAANVGKTITLASGALLTVNADGSYIFDPNGKYESLAQGKTATATFTYQTIDEQGGLSPAAATVTITINGVNDAPIAVNDTRTTGENTILNVTGTGILANDTDIDAGAIKSVATVNGSTANIGVPIAIGLGGLLTVNATGSYTFNPNGKYDYLAVGQSATETFTYQTKDEFGALSNVATVTITITGANDTPIAVADSGVTDEHSILNVAASGLLQNDTDIDNGAVLAVARVNNVAANVGKAISIGAGALLTVNADGSYVFNPNGKYENLAEGKSATVTFTYQVVDGQGALSSAATVTLTINGVNDAPVAVNDVRTTNENTKVTVAATGVLSNDTDLDTGATRAVGEVNGTNSIGTQIVLASGALLTLNSDGSYVYDPNGKFEYLAAGVNGTDTFTYRAIDDKGALSNLATVTLTITGVNDAPVAVNDSGSTTEDSKLVAGSGVLLANDTDVDIGNTLIISSVNGVAGNVGKQITLASGALLNVSADGGYTYDPNGKFNYLKVGELGTDSFTYQIKDNTGAASGTAKVTLQIVGTLPPVVFDLNGDHHIDLVSTQNSTAHFDLNNDGHAEKIAWVGANDALLVYDYQQDGKVTDLKEISFTNYLAGAQTDLEGLKAFDTNHNNQLDAGDKDWHFFDLWQDKNGNAVVDDGEMSDLTSHGVVSLSLISDGQSEMIEGNLVTGYTHFETANGQSYVAGDVKLGVEPYHGQAIQSGEIVVDANHTDIGTLIEAIPAAPVIESVPAIDLPAQASASAPVAASATATTAAATTVVVATATATPAANTTVASLNATEGVAIQHALDVSQHGNEAA